ncbi:PEP-CTERM sorting domain-containing protein [Oceanicoccus sagamiensis]|uniref:Ice-binding protein C-terminal domain-containing protein n=1 Tax=Oceanicoccus sagamiensis TaxID=716816 RepID=A0A1X9N8D9_9GAMM|nr:PEP-CTERM sorting domain-containing protein [Oceanicoccus sagamiensis]ARN73946.1 hypothetical protein BST96_07345 [Oceanicoccus sagamiensis]
MLLGKKLATSALMVGASLFSIASQALVIDFTSSAWQGANSQTTFSNGGVTLTGSDTMTFNGSSGERNGCNASSSEIDPTPGIPLACDGDGIGIRGSDEITGNSSQSLTITFDNAVNIIQIELLDLFDNEGSNGDPEVAIFTLGSDVETFDGIFAPGNNGGYVATGYTASDVTSLTLTAGADTWSDYALARITTGVNSSSTPVAEPSSLALLGLGLLGLARARKNG